MVRPPVALSILILAFCIQIPVRASEQHTTEEQVSPPTAIHGELDLSNISFETANTVPLSGEWSFWWQDFIAPAQFEAASNPPEPDAYTSLRGMWTGTLLNGKKLPAHGYATYRLSVKVRPGEKNLGIRISTMSTAVRIYANGILAASAGSPGTDKKRSIPAFAPQVARIPDPVGGRLDLVMHISNFHYRKGGPWSTIRFGSYDRLIAEKRRDNSYTTLFLGCFLMMGIFHGILFLMRRKEWPSLFMAEFCVALALRITSTNDYIIISAVPWLPFSWVLRAEYLSMILAASSVANMYQRIFPREIKRKAILAMNRLLYILMVVIVLTGPAFFTYTTYIFFMIALPLICYSAYGLISAVRRKRKGSAISFASLVIISLSYLNDYFFVSGLLKTGYISDFTLLFFVLCQAGVLSARLTSAFSEVETLSMELEIFNSQLESQVKERTMALENALDEIKCISVHDALTGCHNRRYMDERLPVEIERALRYGRPISVIMSDIDFFKNVNDTRGHQTGDRVIAFIGKTCLDQIRDKIDIAIRYGGEEFLIILPETKPGSAASVAERIRSLIEANSGTAADIGFTVTASFGVSGLDEGNVHNFPDTTTAEEKERFVAELMQKLIKEADDNMYRAKQTGRNRVLGPNDM